MRWLIAVVTVAGLGWGGWWYIASQGAERLGHATFAQLQLEGYDAGHDGIAVRGFPNRIDLTLSAPRIASSDGAVAWRSDFVQIFSLSYKPWHLVAAVAPEQHLTLPQGKMTLSSPKMRASLIARPTTDLPLDRFALEAEPFGMTLEGAPLLTADKINLASRATPAMAGSHDIGLRIDALHLPVPMADLPQTIDTLLLEARAELDAPLDRHIASRPPQALGFTLRNLQMIWGEVRVQGEGEIRPDPQGLVQGEITLRLRHWRRLMPVLVESGLIAPEFRTNLETALAFMAKPDPEGADTLTLPLRLQAGEMTLGPLRLGPAPAFPRW
jgi:hypothetical protein